MNPHLHNIAVYRLRERPLFAPIGSDRQREREREDCSARRVCAPIVRGRRGIRHYIIQAFAHTHNVYICVCARGQKATIFDARQRVCVLFRF